MGEPPDNDAGKLSGGNPADNDGGAARLRCVVGGVFMGLANLVPGISGGTMLLVTGVYERFVDAVAELSTLKFRAHSFVTVGIIGASAAAVIVLFAGPVKDLVVEHRWVMYALFLGLTLGGLPVVWRMARPLSAAVAFGAVAGFVPMVWMAFGERAAGGGDANLLLLFFAGLAGASAMILPGISGALGQYEVILATIDDMKGGAIFEAATLKIVVPLGVGVLVGVAGVSNLVKWALREHEKFTLGVLLGFLAGAVPGIWPFQEGVQPAADHRHFDSPEKWPLRYFDPTVAQIGMALGLVAIGLFLTLLIDRFGKSGRK